MQHKPYRAYSRELGEYFGLPQLWNDYGLVAHAGLQVRLGRPWQDDWNRATALHVLGHCPELLAQVDSTDDRQLYHAAMGMISQYPLADIVYFLTFISHRDKRPEENEAQHNRITRALGSVTFGWSPCPATMDFIEEIIRVRRSVPA